jgi:DNA-binding protein YbaB
MEGDAVSTAKEPIPPTGDPELNRMMTALNAQTARFEKVSRDLAETRGRGRAADGRVAVEVTSGGNLAGVTIDPGALGLGADGLAEAIVLAAKRAEQDVAERANQALEPLLNGFPPDPDH